MKVAARSRRVQYGPQIDGSVGQRAIGTVRNVYPHEVHACPPRRFADDLDERAGGTAVGAYHLPGRGMLEAHPIGSPKIGLRMAVEIDCHNRSRSSQRNGAHHLSKHCHITHIVSAAVNVRNLAGVE